MIACSSALPSAVQRVPKTRQHSVHGSIGPTPGPPGRIARSVVAQPARAVRIGETFLERQAEPVERDRVEPERREPGIREREIEADVRG